MTGEIFNVQRFSINDGPGIRTTVFFKGCPLNCIWCHNPESKNTGQEVFYSAENCIGCGKCVKACKNNCHTIKDKIHSFERKWCVTCGKCADKCVSGAIEMAGYTMTSEDVLIEVLKDKIFYEQSGGGVTLSGGEPLYQFDFAVEILMLCKTHGLHTAIETLGFVNTKRLSQIIPFVDIFLYDYKETNPFLHKEYTGVSNDLILKNLICLDKNGGKTILRCPIIPNYNNRNEHFDGIINVANNLKNLMEINIEPYHSLGESKARRLGREYVLKNMPCVKEACVFEWIEKISSSVTVPVKKA